MATTQRIIITPHHHSPLEARCALFCREKIERCARTSTCCEVVCAIFTLSVFSPGDSYCTFHQSLCLLLSLQLVFFFNLMLCCGLEGQVEDLYECSANSHFGQQLVHLCSILYYHEPQGLHWLRELLNAFARIVDCLFTFALDSRVGCSVLGPFC